MLGINLNGPSAETAKIPRFISSVEGGPLPHHVRVHWLHLTSTFEVLWSSSLK